MYSQCSMAHSSNLNGRFNNQRYLWMRLDDHFRRAILDQDLGHWRVRVCICDKIMLVVTIATSFGWTPGNSVTETMVLLGNARWRCRRWCPKLSIRIYQVKHLFKKRIKGIFYQYLQIGTWHILQCDANVWIVMKSTKFIAFYFLFCFSLLKILYHTLIFIYFYLLHYLYLKL